MYEALGCAAYAGDGCKVAFEEGGRNWGDGGYEGCSAAGAAAGEVDMGGLVGAEREYGGSAEAGCSWSLLVDRKGVVGRGYIPPVTRMTFPERSGTSVSGLKPLKETMVMKVQVV